MTGSRDLQGAFLSLGSSLRGEVISTPVTPGPECGTLRAAVEGALGHVQEAHPQIAQVQAELRERRGPVGRNSSHSSSPPALDPPGTPKPVVKAPTGRQPGGQPGHSGHIIAIDSLPSASSTSCRSCPPPAPTARPRRPTTPPPATPNRPGIRSPRSPGARRSSPMRLGVMWRKNALSSQSATGCQFATRMQPVVQTLRLQKRLVLDYLRRTMIAHRSGLPALQLLGQRGN